MIPAPMKIQARNWRLSVRTASSMRAARAKGTGRSSAASNAESSSSVPPRTGLWSLVATTAMARMGTMRTMKAARQQQGIELFQKFIDGDVHADMRVHAKRDPFLFQ